MKKSLHQQAWLGMVAVVVVYFVTLIITFSQGKILSLTNQWLFAVVFLLVAFYSLKTDNFSFRIPWMAETETTLKQPLLLRSLPWLVIVYGLFQLFLSLPGITSPLVHQGVSSGLYGVVTALIGIVINVFIAQRIKHGDSLIIHIMIALAILGLVAVIGSSHYIAPTLIGTGYYGLVRYALPYISIAWSLFILLKYRLRMIADGQSYTKMPGFNAQADRRFRNLGCLILIIVPSIVAFLISAAATRQALKNSGQPLPTYQSN